MTERVFVDSNVLVYARDGTQVEKQPRAEAWLRYLWRNGAGRLSHQVLAEFYVTVTQRLKPRLDRPAARRDVRALLAWKPVVLEEQVLEEGWNLQDAHQLSWWDALIAAAAQAAGCTVLLSEDFRDGQELAGLTVVNPFLHAPPDEPTAAPLASPVVVRSPAPAGRRGGRPTPARFMTAPVRSARRQRGR